MGSGDYNPEKAALEKEKTINIWVPCWFFGGVKLNLFILKIGYFCTEMLRKITFYLRWFQVGR